VAIVLYWKKRQNCGRAFPETPEAQSENVLSTCWLQSAPPNCRHITFRRGEEMFEMRSATPAMMRKEAVTALTSILRSWGSLATLLLFLMAAVTNARATATTTTLKIGLTSAPATAVTSEPYSSPLTLTATLTPASVAGHVAFTYGTYAGGASGATNTVGSCSSVAVSGTTTVTATCSVSNLPVGAYYLLAAFTPTTAGDTSSTGSNTTTAAYNVTQASTTTALTATVGGATLATGGTIAENSVVTLTAGVTSNTPAAGSLSGIGTVTYNLAGSPIFGCNAVPVGTTCAVSFSAVNTSGNLLTASYSSGGSTSYNNSPTSSTFTIKVAAGTTPASITLTPSATTVSAASGLSLTAKVTVSGATAAAGYVTFYDNGATVLGTVNLGAGTTVSSSTAASATLAGSSFTGSLVTGANGNSITAKYFGNATFDPITSSSSTVTLLTPTTISSLTVSATTATFYYGQRLTLTAHGLPSAATGTVNFYDASSLIATVAASGGTASFSTSTSPPLALGAHTFTAQYVVDTTYAASNTEATSPTTTTVNPTSTHVVAAASGGATQLPGSSIQLSATVTSIAAEGSFNVSAGNVTFYDSSTLLGKANVIAGTATLSPNITPAAGKHYFIASYGGVYSSGVVEFGTSLSSSAQVNITDAQTITFTPLTSPVTYGASPVSLLATSTSSLTVTIIGSGACSVASGTLTFNAAGLCTVTASQAGNGSWAAATSVTQYVTVNPKHIGIVAPSPAAIAYGAPVPTPLTPSYVTFVNGDSSLSLTTQPTCTTTYTTVSAPGAYPTSCSGAVDPNYTFYYITGLVTVNRASQTFTNWPSTSTTAYGTPVTLAATASSGGTVWYKVISGPGTVSGTTLTPTGAGSIVVTANQAGNSDYAAATPAEQTVTVSQASLLITASSPSAIVYGAPMPAITASYIGFVNGDTKWSMTTRPTCTAASYTITSAPGLYTTSCPGAVDANYSISYATGSFTVNQASQTIGHWFNSSTIYGTPIVLSAVASSGLTITYSVISGPGAITNGGTTLTPSGVGTIVVAANQAGNTDYTAAIQVTKSFTVYPAPLVITATPPTPSVTFGETEGAITPSYATFVNGDSSASLTTAPTCFTSYSTASVPGSYPAICYGAADPNYDITYAAGSISVGKATPTVTAASTGSNPYGTVLNTTNWTFTTCTAVNPNNSASVPGTCSWTNTGASPHVGGAAQGVTFTPTTTTDYNNGTSTASVTVTKASLTVGTMPTASSVPFGSALSLSRLSGGTATSNVTLGAVPGAYTWALGDSPTLVMGANAENVTFTATAGTDFNPASTSNTPVSVTVTKGTPTGIVWPVTCSSPYAFTYGQALSTCTFSDGSATTPSGGTFAWTNPSAKPAVGTSVSESVTYTPKLADQTDYTTATGTVHITVQAVAATVGSWPSASSITYGQTLSSSSLSGGYACSAACTTSNHIAGAFTWSTSDAASSTYPTVGSGPYSVTFTPSNLTTYSAVSSTVSLTVNQATPTVLTWPVSTYSSPVFAGNALSGFTLSGGTDSGLSVNGGWLGGSFGWTNSAILAAAGTNLYSVTFTPTDTTDYNNVVGSVSATANPCGYQDSSNPTSYSSAVYLYTNGTTTAAFTLGSSLDAEGINESAICAVNTSAEDPSGNVTIAQPFITANAASTVTADANKYGTNSAVLAYGTDTTPGDGAVITITDDGAGDPGSISTSNDYSNGVFASYGGAVNITDTIISTTGNYARGLVATYGGTLVLNNVQVSTAGSNSAAIMAGIGASGSSVTVNGGTYTTSGARSAGIRAAGTASTVAVNDGNGSGTVISAQNGPAVVVEGGNTVSIDSGGNATALSGALGDNHGIFLYQGTLGDDTPGTSVFSMTGGSITYTCDATDESIAPCPTGLAANDQNSPATLFSVSNTSATISLTDVTVTNTTPTDANVLTGSNGTLLTVAALSHSGGTATFNAQGETLNGDIIVDATSTANVSLLADGSAVGSTLTGAINNANSGGTVTLILDATSTWSVTGDSYLTLLTNPVSGNTNITCATPGCTVHAAGQLVPGVI
jgi:hypothetical protein